MYITLSDRPQAPVGTPRGRRRVAPVVVTLGIVSLVTDISSESVAAILPLYLTTGALGLSTISYGFVDSLYQGVSALVRIGGGWAADRGGHPKWVAFLGYGLSAAARFVLLFSTGLAAISAVISADRIGKGLRTAPRDAMISAATPPDRLGAAFGVHRTLDTIGAVIGPLLAFAILWWIPDGFLTVMVVSFGFALLGVALLGLLVPDRPADRTCVHPRRERTPVNWRRVAQPGLVRLLVAAGGLGLLTVGDSFIYLALLEQGDFATHWFPLLYVGTNIAYLALAIPIGHLADRIGKTTVLIWGHAALLSVYAVTALSWNPTAATLLAVILLGTFYAATDGVIAALAGRLVPSDSRASGIASAQTVVALARMASSALFGVLWFALGPQLALAVVGTALLVALPLALTAVRSLDTQAKATR